MRQVRVVLHCKYKHNGFVATFKNGSSVTVRSEYYPTVQQAYDEVSSFMSNDNYIILHQEIEYDDAFMSITRVSRQSLPLTTTASMIKKRLARTT